MRNQATLWWVWDTSGLKPGRYALTFTRLPEQIQLDRNLLPAPAGPGPSAAAGRALGFHHYHLLHFPLHYRHGRRT